MIRINNLSKQYRNNYALYNVNLELPRGIIIGVVGPNGAGKTTMLKCITKLIPTYSGDISIDHGASIGLVLDNLTAYKNRTLKFNLEYFRIVKGLESSQNSLEILNQLRFDTNLLNSKLNTFSYGMNQKVVTALSLMSNPNIVLLDEPFRGLDVESIDAFKNLLSSFKTQNKLVLFSSHNFADVEEICDQVIVLNRGRVLDIIDAKVVGDSRMITFNTNNDAKALELVQSYNPIFNNNKISLELENNQWNEILSVFIANGIEVLNVTNNSQLRDRVVSLLKGDTNVR